MLIEINGRWLSKPLTGTGRYSSEVTKVMLGEGAVTLWVPADAVVPSWARAARIRRMRCSGQWFEQVALPLRTLGRPLLSMGGPAPAFKRNQVVVLHDATPFRLPQTYSRTFAAWYRWLYRRIVRSGAQIATVSRFSARELAHALAIPEGQILVAEPAAGRATSSRRPDSRLPDKFFLTVGTLAAHKNIVPVVTAMVGAGLNVVTVGEEGASQVFAASGLPDGAGVIRLGRVHDDELQWLYTHARALLFPSIYEGFGLPALEAQTAGCPVIASNAGPMPEVLGSSAILCDPGKSQQFVDAARSLLESEGARSELIARGRQNALRFSWVSAAAVLRSALRERQLSGRRAWSPRRFAAK